MLTIYWVEFTSNLAVELHGEKRKNYKTGDLVAVTRDDRTRLLRLGCVQVAEKEVEFDDVFTKEDQKTFEQSVKDRIQKRKEEVALARENHDKLVAEQTKQIEVDENGEKVAKASKPWKKGKNGKNAKKEAPVEWDADTTVDNTADADVDDSGTSDDDGSDADTDTKVD